MGLESVEHVVVLMLENRSFDHMLGFLYADTPTPNVSPLGHPFDGLTGTEANKDAGGTDVPVFRITAGQENAYWYPLCLPGEGYVKTNQQLFGITPPPEPPVATNQGFVTSFIAELAHPRSAPLQGATASSIMGMYTPEMLPILSGLAKGYAVCDRWFASVPSETFPNRAFALAGTSLGRLMDSKGFFDTPSIFGRLTAKPLSWKIYGYTRKPLTQMDFPDTRHAPAGNFGLFADFKAEAGAGTLPAFAFLEPEWASGGPTLQNDQHPVSSLANGEAFIAEAYRAVKDGPGWNSTLLVITYDEHGGCYDHVPPPLGATAPDDSPVEQHFDFKRFGVRVPTVLVSPLIEAGTVYRAPAASPPLDHTSLLATIERRWGIDPLGRRDAAAADVGSVLTLAEPRTDDPLAAVQAPPFLPPTGANAAAIGTTPTKVLAAHAQMAAELPIKEAPIADPEKAVASLKTAADYSRFIDERLTLWNNAKGR
jgi:phospholipase C